MDRKRKQSHDIGACPNEQGLHGKDVY